MSVLDGPAVVIGASGGIGAALVDALRARDAPVTPFARSFTGSAHLDLTHEPSIADAAASAAHPALVVVATGSLELPEKSLAQLDPVRLAQAFSTNAIGPALVAKHFLPRQPRDRPTVFAVLSARVGSIGDNRLGGWHGYRASKAALNQLVRTLAIEQARRNPRAVVAALHPGTVDTALSRPFQANVPRERLFTPDQAAAHLLTVIDRLTPADSGRLWAWDGQEIVP